VNLRKWLIAAAVALLTVIITYAAVYNTIAYLNKQDRIRIVRNDLGGALMAVDVEGLRLLNEYYASLLNEFNPSQTLIRVTDGMIKNGLVLIPEGTKAEFIDESCVFPGGRLEPQYLDNRFQMWKHRAVHVERIRITQPPHKNLEGWVAADFLSRGGGPWP
jgi:hypothetical protein